MDDAIRVLYVDDDSGFRDLVTDGLELEDERLAVETAPDAAAGMEILRESRTDCLVSDYDMPGQNGIDFLESVRAEWPDLPFILFTGKGSEEVASDAISAGVTDYLQKSATGDQFTLLANRIANSVDRYFARQDAEWHRTVIRNMGEGVYIFDADYVMRFVNFRISEVEGLSESDWTGSPVSHLADLGLLTASEVEAIRDGADRILAGEREEVRIELEPALPEPTDVLELRLRTVTATTDEELVIGTTRDVTERARRERELRETTQQFQAVLDTIEAAVFIKDTRGRYQLANQKTRRLLGLDDDEEIVGLTDRDLLPAEAAEQYQTDDRAVIDREETVELVEEVPTPDGTRTHLTLKTPFYDDDDVLMGVCGVSTDITERTAQQERIERQNERLDEFASIVSHDLRNPLNVAVQARELTAEDCDSESLEMLARAHDRMEALIDDLLQLAREGADAADPEPVQLETLATECWNHVATADATLRPDTSSTVVAVRPRLTQLFENLVRNAVEHGGETVTVTVGDLENGFFVEDDGTGIDADRRDTLLEGHDGDGPEEGVFGLSIVKQVADTHGWNLAVSTGSDGGARFEFTDVERAD
jgi:PAS domain S-box-containing protein